MRSDAQPDVCAGAPFDAGSYTPIESRRPGLNGATFLLPRSPPDAGSPFPTPEAMIPRALFDRVSTTPGDVITDLSQPRIVAIRFDICDRSTTAPCGETADGVIRLVLLPTFNDGSVEDVALHAFSPVPRNEVYEAGDTLCAVARFPVDALHSRGSVERNDVERRQRLRRRAGRPLLG